MTWFKVDDSFHSHAKLAELEAGPCFAQAIALWTVAGSWCADQLTDGRVPAAQLRKLVPFAATKAASELVRVGLWIEAGGGYQFHGWVDYQPTKARVEADRTASAGRLAKWREKNRSAVANADVTPLQASLPTDAKRDPVETVTPTRPDPTRPDLSLAGETRAPGVATPNPKSTSRFLDSFGPPPSDPIATLAKAFSDARHAAGFGRWTWDGKNHGSHFEQLEKLDAALAAESDLDRPTALAAAFRGFFSDSKAQGVKCPLAWLAADAGSYIAAGRTIIAPKSSSPLAIAEAAVLAARDAHEARIGEEGASDRQRAFEAAKAKLARLRAQETRA